MKRILKVFLFLCFFIFTFADLQAAPFFYEYRSPWFLGQGGAGLANPHGVESLYDNPSVLSLSPKMLNEISLLNVTATASSYPPSFSESSDTVTSLQKLTENPSYYSASNSSGAAFKWFAFGFLTSNDVALYRTEKDTANETYHVNAMSYNSFNLGLSLPPIKNRLLIGITGKVIDKTQVKIDDTAINLATNYAAKESSAFIDDNEKKGVAIGADVAATFILYKPNSTHISLVLKNINTPYNYSNGIHGAPDSDPMMLNIGLSSSFGTRKSRFSFYADYYDLLDKTKENYMKKIHAGTTLSVLNLIFASVGLNQGYFTASAGLSFFGFLKLNAGVYSEELGESYSQLESKRYFASVFMGYSL